MWPALNGPAPQPSGLQVQVRCLRQSVCCRCEDPGETAEIAGMPPAHNSAARKMSLICLGVSVQGAVWQRSYCAKELLCYSLIAMI